MDLDLTEEQEMLKTMARDFLQKECPKSLVRELEESDQGYSEELWHKMAELGWMGLNLPDEYDGLGSTFMDLALLLEEMGRNILPSPFFSTVVLGAFAVMDGGTEEQKTEILPKLANGEIIMALAWLEPDGSYEPKSITTHAVASGDDYVINGTKLFVADASVADYLVAITRTKNSSSPEEGITLFLVDAKSPGVKCAIVPTIGLDKQCEVVFNDVRIPKKNMLGELDKGWSLAKRILMRGMVGKCAEMVGGAQATLDMANDYAKERVQYGKPIGSFQVIQHYLANMWIDVNTSRSITYEAAWRVSENLPCIQDVAIAKGWVNDAYNRVTERGIQVHGAIGTTRDHDMGLYYRRSKAAELAFGDTGFCEELIAQEREF